MIKQLEQKPEGLFKKLPDHYMWFELYYKKEVYCYIGIEIISVWAAFHMHVIKWNHNITKTFFKDWKTLKATCRELGATTVIASNEDLNDKKWPKFIKMFGFPEPKHLLISNQEI